MPPGFPHTCTLRHQTGTGVDAYGQPSATTTDYPNTPCRFVKPQETLKKITGNTITFQEALPQVMLPNNITGLLDGDQIISTVTGFVGTFNVHAPLARYRMADLSHWTADILKVV